jgi:hypothetical protein
MLCIAMNIEPVADVQQGDKGTKGSKVRFWDRSWMKCM